MIFRLLKFELKLTGGVPVITYTGASIEQGSYQPSNYNNINISWMDWKSIGQEIDMLRCKYACIIVGQNLILLISSIARFSKKSFTIIIL